MDNESSYRGPTLWDSFKLTAISALRTAPMWVTAGVFGAALLSTTNNREEPEPPTALVEFGLTDEVVWPFFDVALSEALSSSQALETSVEGLLGDSLLGYEATLPEGRGIVKVLITAETPEDVERAADLVASEVIDQNFQDINEGLTTQIQLFRDAEVAEAAELEAIIERINAVTVQFTPTILEAERRNLDQQLQVLFIERDAAQRAQLSSKAEANGLQRRLDLADSEIELANVTVTVPTSEPVSRLLLVATGLGIAIAAATVLTTWHRDFGPIRSEEQLRAVIDLPIVPYPNKLSRSVPLARQLLELQETGVRVVGFSSIPDAPECVEDISETLAVLNSFKKFGAMFDVATTSTKHEVHSLFLTSLDPDSNSDSILTSHLESKAAFVVVNSKGTKLRNLRARIRDLSTLGLDVQGVVLK